MDRNKHVNSYLKHYVGFAHPPRFAVLLNGPWGIGKTFLLKQFLSSLGPEVKHVYVSLYGLTSLDEIDDALFRAMYPVLEHQGVRLAGRALKALGKYFQIEVDAKAGDLLSRAHADLFVFDDLERCDVPVNRVLGYINEFVEHEGRKVIIVANEKEIRDAPDYGRIREKLIGKTLELRSAFEQALDSFLAAIDDETAHAFLATQTGDLASLYDQSGLQNLRILQQSIWDFERLHRALADKHRANELAMGALLRLVLSLSFEIKAGRLVEANLQKRQTAIMTSLMRTPGKDGAPSPMIATRNRYPSADIGSSILSDETLTDLLVRGIVDGDRIQEELDASSYFVTVADEPAWRTVWHAFERTDEEFRTAFEKMEQAFAAREYARSGEILHVFGLRLWLSDIGVLALTREEVVEQGRRYLDDLSREARIEPASPREGLFGMRFDGYGGLGIQEHETSEYKTLFAYLQEKRRAAEVEQHPKAAAELLALLANDTDEFFRAVNLVNGADNRFYDVPILAALEPSDFATALLALHPARQRVALMALQSRYEHGSLDRELAPERVWATEVRKKLLAATETMSPIGKYRIRKILTWTLEKALAEITPAEEAK